MQSREAQIAEALSAWFMTSARDLPWRRTRDSYAIWVSEVMLQQTRVQTVERYYAPFLERFPDLDALATADEDSVLAAWSGLGYYRRARMLHAGAKYVREYFDSELPRGADLLRQVPGVGPYTAGAISSIAHDEPVPLVDGNIARVMSRLEALREVKEQPATHPAHAGRVGKILEAGRPRVLAQALMELGATICTPRSPTCLTCPVRENCEAHAEGLTETIPAPKQRKAPVLVELFALRVRWGQQVLLERRPDKGVLAGLWTMPVVERRGKSRRPPGGAEPQGELATQLGVELVPEDGWPAGGVAVEHVFTHRRWRLQVLAFRCRKRPGLRGLAGPERRWWSLTAADGAQERAPSKQDLPGGMPMLTRKLLRAQP